MEKEPGVTVLLYVIIMSSASPETNINRALEHFVLEPIGFMCLLICSFIQEMRTGQLETQRTGKESKNVSNAKYVWGFEPGSQMNSSVKPGIRRPSAQGRRGVTPLKSCSR